MALVNLTPENFDKAVSGDKPAFIDFWAPWCGPCRQFLPIIEEVEKEMGAKFDFYKVNVEEYPELANRFGISGIPTSMIFKKGVQIAQHSGAMGKSQFAEYLNQFA
ncbi:MAG: thioredoxin [Alphaproteobacteria bacterium]|nr:thioredoxin [Alphaproteobacteria bacterium]